MKRNTIFLSVILLLFIGNSCKNETFEEKVDRIHNEALTVDTHTDTPLRFTNRNMDVGERGDSRKGGGKYDLPRMKEGGLDAVFFAVFLGQRGRDEESMVNVRKKTDEIFDALYEQINKYPDLAEFAYNSSDAARIEKEGKRAIYIGLENGYPVGKDLSYIKKYYDKGARYITLCHTSNNDICDSSTDKQGSEHDGLSEFGKEVVQEMNKLGMLIDVSHISDKSFYDVIELSKTPVFASHSDAKAICDNPRNLTDDMLLKLKENGGVIQLCLLSDYVKKMPNNQQRDSAMTALREKYHHFDRSKLSDEEYDEAVKGWYDVNDNFPPNLANVSDLVDHVDHIVNLIGVDYVGIGSDFDGGGGLKDCFDVTEFKNITRELVTRGYSEEDIYKIWGGNFFRVFAEVEKIAKEQS